MMPARGARMAAPTRAGSGGSRGRDAPLPVRAALLGRVGRVLDQGPT